jgi:hypothetical protein
VKWDDSSQLDEYYSKPPTSYVFFPTTMVSFFRAETPRASTAMSREAGRERRDEQRSGLETGFTKGERSKDTYMTVTCFAYSR